MSATHTGFGNSYDSDNNSQDFVLRTTPNPQNRLSTPERCCTTVSGTLTRQGRSDHSGIQVLMWPGSNLKTMTDTTGYFAVSGVPAIASQDTAGYTLEVIAPGYLAPKTTVNLASYDLSLQVNFPTLSLFAGDLNNDNRINIFDVAIIGGQYGSTGAALTGDINGDGRVNIQDLALVSGNFGQSIEVYSWALQQQ